MADNHGRIVREWPADTAEIYREIADEDRQLAAMMTGIRKRETLMSPEDRESSLARLHTDLCLKRLNPVWAKIEIFGGLFAVAAGVLMMTLWAVRPSGEVPAVLALGGVGLFVLGGYLAMAGHRSHLYQSNNLMAAYLADEIRKHSPKV
jgi:hypothetical protein